MACCCILGSAICSDTRAGPPLSKQVWQRLQMHKRGICEGFSGFRLQEGAWGTAAETKRRCGADSTLKPPT
eukprot:scaffold193803_cov32-Tisochrysis_lutea.AAC.7